MSFACTARGRSVVARNCAAPGNLRHVSSSRTAPPRANVLWNTGHTTAELTDRRMAGQSIQPNTRHGLPMGSNGAACTGMSVVRSIGCPAPGPACRHCAHAARPTHAPLVQRAQRHGARPHLAGRRREAELDTLSGVSLAPAVMPDACVASPTAMSMASFPRRREPGGIGNFLRVSGQLMTSTASRGATITRIASCAVAAPAAAPDPLPPRPIGPPDISAPGPGGQRGTRTANAPATTARPRTALACGCGPPRSVRRHLYTERIEIL